MAPPKGAVEPSFARRPRSKIRTTVLATGAGVAMAAAAVAAERYLVRRARSRPDPARDEPMTERPGREHRITSFDGTELSVHVVGPDESSRADSPAEGSPVVVPPTLVFVHGFSLDLTAWHYQWKHFGARYRCVLYDQRGHGRSGRAAGGDHSLSAMARDLEAVLEGLEVGGPIILIGHSMGGMAVLAFAAEMPEEMKGRVAGVVFANAAAADVLKGLVGGLGARAGAVMTAGLRRLGSDPARVYRIRAAAFAKDANLAFLIAKLTNFGPKAPPSVIEHVISLAADTDAEVWTDGLRSLLDLDLSHAMEHVTVPALVLVGDADRLTPPSTALAMKRRLPDAQMVVLRGAGHCMMLERYEQWNEVVDEFATEAVARWRSSAERKGRKPKQRKRQRAPA